MRITMVAILVAAFGAGCDDGQIEPGERSCLPLTYFLPCAPSGHPLTGTCLAGDNTTTDPVASMPQVDCGAPLRDTDTGEIYTGTCVASCP